MTDQVMATQQKTQMAYYRQPTLPHLLQEYGLQSKAYRHGKKEEKKEKKKTDKKESKKSGSFLPDDDRDIEREKEMDEHYLKMVRDMYHLRDYYYNEYSALLNDKVEKQRREMRERDAKFQNAQLEKEEKERKESHQVKKRLERHTLETTPETAAVTKTDLYYIMGLEDKLRREGKLKTPSDFNKFRRDMNEPHIFYANFKVNKNSDFTRYSEPSVDLTSSYGRGESNDTLFEMTPDSVKRVSEQDKNQHRSLSRISESRESPLPQFRRDSWAVTQQFPAQHKSRKSISNIPSVKPKSEQLSDLEKRFPKLEMPKLHCFTLNLNKKPPDPEEVRQQTELRAKEKGRKKAMRTYTKMYQLAMTNAATTSRIMDNFEDMNMLLQGPNLCDVIADEHWMQAYGLTNMNDDALLGQSPPLAEHESSEAEDGRVQSRARTPPMLGGQPVPAISRGSSAVSEKSQSQRTGSGSRRSRRSSAKSKSESPKEELSKIIPLTMEEIRDDCNIKESKTMSSLWSNYMRAGKSPWTVAAQ